MSVWNSQQPSLERPTPSHDLLPLDFSLTSLFSWLFRPTLDTCRRVSCSCIPWLCLSPFHSTKAPSLSFCLSVRHPCNLSTQSSRIFTAKWGPGLNCYHLLVSGVSRFITKAGVRVYPWCQISKGKIKITQRSLKMLWMKLSSPGRTCRKEPQPVW